MGGAPGSGWFGLAPRVFMKLALALRTSRGRAGMMFPHPAGSRCSLRRPGSVTSARLPCSAAARFGPVVFLPSSAVPHGHTVAREWAMAARRRVSDIAPPGSGTPPSKSIPPRRVSGVQQTASGASRTISGVSRRVSGVQCRVTGTARLVFGAQRRVLGTGRGVFGVPCRVLGTGRLVLGTPRLVFGVRRLVLGIPRRVLGTARLTLIVRCPFSGTAPFKLLFINNLPAQTQRAIPQKRTNKRKIRICQNIMTAFLRLTRSFTNG